MTPRLYELRRYEARPRKRGISRVEVLVILLSVFVGVAFLLVALQGSRKAPELLDGVQLRGIAQSFSVAGRDLGELPSPSRIARLPVPVADGEGYVPGVGEVDATLDTTANLYSMMIAQNYFTPELAVSLVERNPRVVEKMDYAWEKYDPGGGVYWDDAFQADLATESNASYAHLLLWGKRKSLYWQDALNSSPDGAAIFSSRGPKDGIERRDSFTCDRQGKWTGFIVMPGGSTQKLDSIQGWEHLFRVDDGLDGADPVLSFTLEIDAEAGPTIQHD